MTVPSFDRGRACLHAALLVGATLLGGGTGEDVADATIPAFNAVFGVPQGLQFRPVHTKGVVVEGTFIPAPTAASVSNAAHLTGGPVPVTVRLSTFAGVPDSPDAGPFAAPQGMAIKFRLSEDVDTDLVAHSYNGFPAATPEEFLDFLHALAAGNGNAAPGEGAFDHFLLSHAAARAFVHASSPPPVSWANETFFGVNAFVFVNAAGHRRYGRYRIVPSGGEKRLTKAQASGAAPNYLRTALAADLSHGPVSWHILVQLAESGDAVRDGSIAWPSDRPVIELGLLRLDRLVTDGPAVEHDLLFSPLNLVPGIEPSKDPILAARSRAYGESYRRRTR